MRPQAETLFSRSEIFGALEPDALAMLAARAVARQYGPGQTIFAAGAPGDAMMAIAEGAVRIAMTTPAGREIVLAELAAGEVFGEIALLDGGPRSAEAKALTNCTLLVLERRAFLQQLRSTPALAERIIDLLCARIRRSDARMLEIGFLELPVRLARLLLRLATDTGRATARLSLSQAEIAAMAGTSRESVNRCLNRWQRDGIVELRDGWLILTDRAALARLAGDD